jgi:hypothetical protein
MAYLRENWLKIKITIIYRNDNILIGTKIERNMTTRDNNYYKSAIICIALGMIIVSQSYLFGYKGSFSYTLFWIGILFSTISVLIMILNVDSQNKKLIILFCFGLLLYLPVIFWSPSYFRFQDEIYHANNLGLILENNGTLNINPLLEISKYYPGIEFLTIFIMKFSGLSLFTSAKILIGILHSLVLIFVYFLFKIITSSQRIAIIGSFIYAANPSYAFFDAIFSYETMGILLMIILIFIVYKYGISTDKFSISLISLIILGALVMTHHFSSYMFSIFMIILTLSTFYGCHLKIVDNRKLRYISTLTITTIILIFLWIIFQAQMTIRYFGGMMSKSISSILSFIVEDVKIQRIPFWQTQLPKYETFVDTYIYIPILFLLYIYGIYLINKKYGISQYLVNKNNSRLTDPIYVSLVLYGFMFFISLSLIFTTAGQTFMYRSWAFTFIGLSFSVGIALDGLMKMQRFFMRYLVYIIVLLIIMGGVSIGNSYTLRDPNFIFASVPSSVTLDVIKASDWFNVHFDNNNNILGDSTIRMVFGGYGYQKVRTDPYIFYRSTIDSESISYLKYDFRHNFIIVDKRITEKLSELKYYFESKELKIEDHKWGYTETFPIQNIEKFDRNDIFYKIYDNKNINIYYINKLYIVTV